MRTIPEDEIWVNAPKGSILEALCAESKKIIANSQTTYKHRGGRGDHREKLFRDFLESRLPQNVATCKGHIQDATGQMTSEFDILLYDPSYRMVICKTEEQRMDLPVEAIVAAIEVRTRVDGAAVRDVAKKIDELSKLKRSYSRLGIGGAPDSPVSVGARQEGPLRTVLPIPVVLLGFDSTNCKKVVTELEKHEHQLPDMVICLGMFFWGKSSPWEESMFFEAPHTELAMFMLHLTAYVLRAKSSAAVPDLLHYFRIHELDV